MTDGEYSIQFLPASNRDLRRMSQQVNRRIRQAIANLSVNPRLRGHRKMKGFERLYRVRVGDYRVIYEIDDGARLVRITRIMHRRDVYRSF